MVRAPALSTACVLAAAGCLAWQSLSVFVPAPALRGDTAATATAAATAAALSIPGAADAFYYDGKEYFDITFGISPLYWALTAFAIICYGAILKNAALKYNKPYGTSTVENPKPPKTGSFKGSEAEFDAPGWKS